MSYALAQQQALLDRDSEREGEEKGESENESETGRVALLRHWEFLPVS